MPMFEEYRELNKSKVADVMNIGGGRDAGSITAAYFIYEFIDKNPPPEAGAKLRIADIGNAYEAEYEAPRAVEMPVPQPPVVHRPKYSIDPEDITVTSEGCIINGRFMPADLLNQAADAVSACQSDEY